MKTKSLLHDTEFVFNKNARWLCLPEFKETGVFNVFGREGETQKPPEDRLKDIHMYTRRAFRVGANAVSAELCLTADDYYKLYINGEFVAEGPASGYPGRYYVNKIDVFKYLRTGENIIALDVYYQGLINRVWVSGDNRQGFILEMRVDGKLLFSSDERFRYMVSSAYTHGSTYGYDTQFEEIFDAREEQPGWKKTGFDDIAWDNCVALQNHDYSFVLQETPLLEHKHLKPVKEEKTDTGLLLDFGREIAGTIHITALGKDGETITVNCAEELDEDGRPKFKTRCGCNYQDKLILSHKLEDYETFDYKGFRYAEIISEGKTNIKQVEAVSRAYPLNEDICILETSDESLAAVFELCKNTIRTGVQLGYIDCPTREKGQYTGDLTVTAVAHMYLSGDTRLYRRSLEDWMFSGFITPGLSSVLGASYMQEIADYSLLFPYNAYQYYRHAKDEAFLKKCLDACYKVLDTYSAYERDDGLIINVTEAWNLVDWPQNLRDGYDFELTKPVGNGCHNVINALYLGAVHYTEKIEHALGINKTNRFETLKAAFNKEFFKNDSGLYTDTAASAHSALHSNCLPLFFEIADKQAYGTIADFIVSKGFSCGVYMAYFVLKALCRAGRHEDAYRLIVSDSEHSWLNMLKEGATTLFEAWGKEQKQNTSLCHPWAAAPVPVLIEDLLGITPEVARGDIWQPHVSENTKSLKLTTEVCSRKLTFLRGDGMNTLISR